MHHVNGVTFLILFGVLFLLILKAESRDRAEAQRRAERDCARRLTAGEREAGRGF